MKSAWNWIVAKRRTLGKIGVAYLVLELLLAAAAVLGINALQ